MRWLSIFVCSLALVVGCGPSAPPPEGIAADPDTSPVANDQLKQMLEQIAQTGEAGSAAAGLRPSIEALKATDAGKGGALLTDLDQLEAATNPDQIKQIAKKMVGKL